MRKTYIVLSLIVTLGLSTQAQTSLDILLESVIKNNKTIKAYTHYADWQKVNAQTGNAPENPEFEYGYFPGNSDAIGTKTIIGVSQSFDFPTTYIHKKKLANQSVILANEEFRKKTQDILLQTWQTWAKAIFYNKKQQVLLKREQEALKMLNYYEKKQHNGDATQLEVNKARLFLIDIQNNVRLHNGLLEQNLEALQQLNGGIEITAIDTTFGSTIIEDWPSIWIKIEQTHPEIALAKQESSAAAYELKLSKAQWLPNLNIGYESEDVLGDKYSGIKGGISIPLWQEKNSVRLSKIAIDYSNANLDNVKTEIMLSYKQMYLHASALKKNLHEFNTGLAEMNNEYLLSRSLELGQISAIEYFMELNYFYEINDQLMELELDYQLSLAELYQFSLI